MSKVIRSGQCMSPWIIRIEIRVDITHLKVADTSQFRMEQVAGIMF